MKRSTFFPALAGYHIGYLYICCFLTGFWNNSGPKTWYPLLFAILFALWAWRILPEPFRRDRLVFPVCMVLTALAMALSRCRATEDYAVLALHGFAVLWALSEEEYLDHWLTCLAESIWGGICLPFLNFFLREKQVYLGTRELLGNTKKGSLKKSLPGLCLVLLAIPLFALAVNLLGQADAAFGSLVEHLFSFRSPRWLSSFLLKFLPGLPIGAWLFGLLAGHKGAAKKAIRPEHCQRFEPKLIVGIWSAFLGLYLLFFAVQATSLFAVFHGTVPGTLTASAYARQGFFQLCQVMVINFLLIGLGQLLCKDQAPLRLPGVLLLVETVFLAVTAAGKLVLYIHRFGFTPLRLLSAWGVGVMVYGCLLAAASLNGRKGCFRAWVYGAAVSFTALCFY